MIFLVSFSSGYSLTSLYDFYRWSRHLDQTISEHLSCSPCGQQSSPQLLTEARTSCSQVLHVPRTGKSNSTALAQGNEAL